MAINNNSYSTNTNITFGSNELENLWLQAQSVSVPGISMASPEIGGRNGTKLKLGADTVTYTDLTISMQMDKDWEIYDTIYKHFLQGLNVEKGTFTSAKTYDLWLDIHVGGGKVVKKFWFYNCRLIDIAEIPLDVTDEADTISEVDLTFQFDYMDYDNSFFKARTE